MGGVNAQDCPTCTSNCPDDVRYSNAAIRLTPSQLVFKLCKPYSIHPDLTFKLNSEFYTSSTQKAFINWGDGTAEVPVSPSEELFHNFIVPTPSIGATFTVTAKLKEPGFSDIVATAQMVIKPTFASGVGGFTMPDEVWPIGTSATFDPPVSTAYPAGSPFLLPTVGTAHAYLKFAPAHNGKLLKPLIFVDGIDFSPKTLTRDGVTIRHGSTGWDVLMLGNYDSSPNSFDMSTSELAAYPTSFNTLLSSPNDYDIVFLDFANGADYIQKNGLLLVELLKQVNVRKKADSNSSNPACENVVVGASMGGQVAKWALSYMEEQGNVPHEVHTYLSFDSPQQGANIPLSLQALSLHLFRTGNDDSNFWTALNFPAARQLLVETLEGATTSGKLALSMNDVDFCGSGLPGMPAPIGFGFGSTNELRQSFIADMAGKGYPKDTRNIAISCGSFKGTKLAFAKSSTILTANLFVNPPNIACDLTGDVASAELAAVNGNSAALAPILSFLGGPGTWGCCTTPLPGVPNAIYQGTFPITYLDWILTPDKLPKVNRNLVATTLVNFPSYDNAPGCRRADLFDVQKLFAGNGFTVPVNVGSTCFMPTISLLDLNRPMDDAHFSNEIDLTAVVANGETPFKAVFAPVANLRHIELTSPMVTWMIAELKKGSDESGLPITLANGQQYNYGNRKNRVPDFTINAGCKLGVNIAGNINYMSPTDPVADKALFQVWTGGGCNQSKNIVVKNGGTLQIGEPTSPTKKGILHVINNSTVHIEPGGNLNLDDDSELIIYPGSTLILGDGANVNLNSKESKIIIRGGTLVVNGAINFMNGANSSTIQGCFQFENRNALVFGNKNNGTPNNIFKLHGKEQFQRFIKITTDKGLDIPSGGHLDLLKGSVEQNGSFNLVGGSTAILKYVNLDGGGLGSGSLVDGQNAGQIRLQFCNVRNCLDCIYSENGTGSTFIIDSHFDNYLLNAVNVINKPALKVTRSTFDGTAGSGAGGINAISADRVPLVQLYRAEISNHYSQPPVNGSLSGDMPSASTSAGVWLNMVSDCIMTGGFIDFCDVGVVNLDGTMPSEFFMYECATIRRSPWGIFMNGSATNGMITMDGGRIHDCRQPIEGTDILLNIEAACGRNNSFIMGYKPGPSQKYIRMCYQLKSPPIPISMRSNYWARWELSSLVEDLNPAPRLAISQNAMCGAPVGAIVVPVVSAARFVCDNGIKCFQDPPGIAGFKEACTIPVNPTTIESQFNSAYAAYMNEDFPTAFSLFEPLSNMAGAGTATYPTWCKQYVDISRAMVDPTANPHSNGKGNTENKTALLRPNPASESVEINLPTGESHVTVTDVFGKKTWEGDCNGNCYLSLAGWPPGMYTVQVFPVGAVRPTVEKLMVVKL